MEQRDNIQTILNAGAAAVQPISTHGGIAFVAVPEGYKIQDLETLLPNPARKHANVITTDTDGFIYYTKKHGSLNYCTIYADIDAREKDGKVTFWYELIRPDRVFKTSVNDELARIKEATGFPVISGNP